MEKELYRIRAAVENIHRLMEVLVAQQVDGHQSRRAAALTLHIEESVVDQPALPSKPEPETLYNRKEAATFLLVHPRTVTRYRISGKLRVVHNEDNQIRYREEDLNDCYFWKWGKRP